MKNITVVLGAVLLAMLTGCSGKPDASDVEKDVKEFWSPCKLVKVTEVRKTNGRDQGRSYRMAISYKLEVVQDVAVEDIWDTKDPKRDDTFQNLNWNGMTSQELDEAQKKSERANAPREAAVKRRNDFLEKNCPGPVAPGHFPPLVFFQVFKDKYGSPLTKGDSVEQSVELDMVKTENGWVSQ